MGIPGKAIDAVASKVAPLGPWPSVLVLFMVVVFAWISLVTYWLIQIAPSAISVLSELNGNIAQTNVEIRNYGEKAGDLAGLIENYSGTFGTISERVDGVEASVNRVGDRVIEVKDAINAVGNKIDQIPDAVIRSAEARYPEPGDRHRFNGSPP